MDLFIVKLNHEIPNLAYLCLFSILSFSVEDKIINYILNDIHSKNEFKTRLTYFESNDEPWQILTSLKNTTSFLM